MHFTLEKSIEVLQRTPGVLHSLLSGLSEDWACGNYGPDTFSPFDVIGHLICAENTNWMVRARCILERGEAVTFPPFDRYAMFETSKGKSMEDLLAEFNDARVRNLNELRSLNLTGQMLARCGKHPEFGAVALTQLLATWVVHDLNHLHQIAKAMAFQYRDAVGPWSDYLSILPTTA